MTRRRPTKEATVQLSLLEPVADVRPTWALEGTACASCGTGRMYMATASDPCTCVEAICICLAEGYALCDCCGELRQVWPREMVTHWEG
ncbi:MAG: hypothetical protein H6733_11110 [Alphaproteobacteria bacterium]|nr:hypothetical protein [Alphaproteobacteria bacterium]